MSDSTPLPETILQFGAGNFLRAFVDLFVQEANDAGQAVGRVVVVQSTDSGRAAALAGRGGRYHVLIRGIQNGEVIDRTIPVSSISRALAARGHWAEILAVARSHNLRHIVSNVTEAGYGLDANDAAKSSPPNSFPGKLTAVLHERFRAGLPGVELLPTELIEGNADRLVNLCLQQAEWWSLSPEFASWLRTACRWHNTLVDRIVPGRPAEHPLLASDPMLIVAEPFALWAIEGDDPAASPVRHEAVRVVSDARPYSVRKIRILNGAHTALVCRAVPLGIRTVREAIEDQRIRPWVESLLFEEIVPTLEGRVDGPRQFAEQTLERFANPFLEHKLSDIAVNHEIKLKARLATTAAEYEERFGRKPKLLGELLGGTNG
jgi:tagaturonate reductase